MIGAVFANYDFQGNPTWGGLFVNGFTEFINNYSWSYRAAYNPQTVNNRRTRGGPLTLNMPGYEAGTYFDTDGKAKLFYFVDVGTYVQPDAGSWNWYLYPGVEWKPLPNVTLNVGPGFDRTVEDAQYVEAYDDPTATGTYGRRYVFAHLEQKTVSANIRLNWAFTPTMSLLTFMQPLISTGEYSGFKSLAEPRSYDFAPMAYTANPDFNFKSLRGNAVFRWEYLPGSTLFLVWTQERTDFEDNGQFRLGPSYNRLLDADADNIFLAKVSYYFNL
jgi:hypothetical protein